MAELGIKLDAKVISFVLAIISLFSVMWGGISYFNGYTYRIDTLEKRNVELTSQIVTLTSTINDLNETIVDLKVSIGRLEVRSNQ